MRPIETLMGPTGAIIVEFTHDIAIVTCRNSLTKQHNTFETTQTIGNKILHWISQDKKNLIQDVVPELAPELREMCISGTTPEEWNRMIKEAEAEDKDGQA